TAVWNDTSHNVGASAGYSSLRARLRRNPRWLVARHTVSIVVYWYRQSTLSPIRRQISSYAFSSSPVSCSHSSMKFRREIASGSFGRSAGGVNDGSYGRDGSHRTP